jgi:hypothetical protein
MLALYDSNAGEPLPSSFQTPNQTKPNDLPVSPNRHFRRNSMLRDDLPPAPDALENFVEKVVEW